MTDVEAVIELERLVMVCLREAQHWSDNPDYYTVNRDAFPEGTLFVDANAEVREFMDRKVYRHRGTHTDIVLRDVAARLDRVKKAIDAGLDRE